MILIMPFGHYPSISWHTWNYYPSQIL